MNAYFASRVTVTEAGCWEWSLSCFRHGYGQAGGRGSTRRAHRLSYEVHVGPIPAGMTVDHLCFNPPCVNPDHLRLLSPVDNSRNQRRASKTHCIRGHEFTPENTRARSDAVNGKRECKTCHRERERARRRKAVGLPDVPMRLDGRGTHCKRGHEFTPENTIVGTRGRECRTCQRANWRRQSAERRAKSRAQLEATA